MIEEFEELTAEERKLLYEAPVLISVFTSCSYNKVNALQKADAIKLSHLKTFTANPLLLSYYIEVEKNFKHQFEIIVQKYTPFDEHKRNMLQKELDKINHVIGKLDKKYAQVLHKSLEGYANHVKKAAHSILQDFIFPIHIRGLNE